MNVFTGDISHQPLAFRAMKRPIPVQVEFAEADGVLPTLEGLVSYQRGDALLTGVAGEHWPMSLDKFRATYMPLDASDENAMRYVKRPMEVWAWVADTSLDIPLSAERGFLHANPGDVLVQYAPGDVYVVAARIFEASYERR